MTQSELLDSDGALIGLLKSKSRGRRRILQANASFITSAAAGRNDLRPTLELVERALVDLVIPARNVRKLEVPHLAEVARAIAQLGFLMIRF